MFRLLLLTILAAACIADEVKPAESGMFIHRDNDGRRRDEKDRLNHHRVRYGDNDKKQQGFHVNLHDDDDFRGPVILRTTDAHDSQGLGPDIARQNKIIADVYSPDYYQPTWILDYRYMKTGGRDYTRGPGGQYLILPKNIHTDEDKEFQDFDSLLEHLRLKNLAEKNEMRERFKTEYEELNKGSRD